MPWQCIKARKRPGVTDFIAEDSGSTRLDCRSSSIHPRDYPVLAYIAFPILMTSKTPPAPKVILFDWHGTLVNTHDAMYCAIEEMLPQLEELNLLRHMIPEHQARSEDDEKLLRYIRIFRHLHPRVLAERRVSRTDIFDALFGDNQQALAIAHKAYDDCYRRHFGDVHRPAARRDHQPRRCGCVTNEY